MGAAAKSGIKTYGMRRRKPLFCGQIYIYDRQTGRKRTSVFKSYNFWLMIRSVVQKEHFSSRYSAVGSYVLTVEVQTKPSNVDISPFFSRYLQAGCHANFP